MSKIVIIFIIFVLQFALLAPNIFALDSCASLGIDYEPKFVPENSGGINFVFTIKNSNTLSNLFNKQVRLHFDKGLGPWDDWASQPATVTSNRFSISVFEDQDLLKKGTYQARLTWQPDPSKDFTDYCSNIAYQVGAPNKCIIDPSLPKEIPPGSSLNIKFIGKADTNYQLRFGTGGPVTNTTTDNQGQGQFDSIPIPGNNGETVRITVISFSPGAESCFWDVKINAAAPPPPSPSSGPIVPAPSGSTCDPKSPAYNPKKCSLGGGLGCGGETKPAIKTAIGCIHTNPGDLIADVLKFALGIGGGLAFLMMILGAFQMLTSAGNPDTLQAGRERLTSAVIGLLIVIFAVLLLQIIGFDILNLPGFGR